MNAQDHSRLPSPRNRFHLALKTRISKRRNLAIHTPAKIIGTAYCIHTVLVLISLLLSDILPLRPPSGFINDSLASQTGLTLESFIKWDAHWYTYVAEYGYDTQSLVFFPALIVFIKLLSYLGLNYAIAGLILCNVFALISYCIMYFTFRIDFPEQVVWRALLAYAVMPTSFFLNSIYTESLFLVFALTCIYCTRKENWLAAGFSGAAATLTRNLGVFLFVYLLYEYLQTRKARKPERLVIIGLCLPPAAMLSYMLYNNFVTGNPLAFLHSQQGWGRYFNSPLDSFMKNIPLMLNGNPYIQPGATLDTFMVLLAGISLLLLTFSLRFRIPSSYLVIGWLWFLIPLMSTSSWLPLYSASRFVLIIFPLYLFLAQLHTILYYCLVTIGAISLSICAALFVNWHWIG